MTSEELEALGRRAVACKGWRWLDGCKLVTSKSDAFRVFLTWDDETYTLWTAADGEIVSDEGRGATSDYLRDCLDIGFPDLRDPATLGCLLARVREAWGHPEASTWFDGVRWAAEAFGPGGKPHRFDAPTEAEALVAALEAAQ